MGRGLSAQVLSVFCLFLFFIFEGFSGFGFYQFACIFFPPRFLGFAWRFSNF
jgi:hypothetical protein